MWVSASHDSYSPMIGTGTSTCGRRMAGRRSSKLWASALAKTKAPSAAWLRQHVSSSILHPRLPSHAATRPFAIASSPSAQQTPRHPLHSLRLRTMHHSSVSWRERSYLCHAEYQARLLLVSARLKPRQSSLPVCAQQLQWLELSTEGSRDCCMIVE